jgi:hypothetical protein
MLIFHFRFSKFLTLFVSYFSKCLNMGYFCLRYVNVDLNAMKTTDVPTYDVNNVTTHSCYSMANSNTQPSIIQDLLCYIYL